ncbi:unnamed protein product, partial [Dibothriocephalus latus]
MMMLMMTTMVKPKLFISEGTKVRGRDRLVGSHDYEQIKDITKLKIDCNPFAKGFRDSARLSDFERESMETLLATHTGTGNGGVIASLSNQFRNYLPSGTERTSEAAEDEALPPKRAPTPTFLHPSVLHQLTEVLSSPSKMHALYRRPSDGEDLVKRLNSLQRHYQSQPGITTT